MLSKNAEYFEQSCYLNTIHIQPAHLQIPIFRKCFDYNHYVTKCKRNSQHLNGLIKYLLKLQDRRPFHIEVGGKHYHLNSSCSAQFALMDGSMNCLLYLLIMFTFDQEAMVWYGMRSESKTIYKHNVYKIKHTSCYCFLPSPAGALLYSWIQLVVQTLTTKASV